MARVPRHYRDKLVSSRVGVNTLDTSGADTARAISKMADQFIRVSGSIVKEQREATDRSELATKKAEYLNKSAIAAQEIQKAYAENPEEGFKVLTRKNQEIKEQVLSGVSNGRQQSVLGADIDGLMAQQSVNNKKWEINRVSAMDQQFLIDVQQMNVDTIMQGATAEEYEIMMGDDTFTEENYKRAWGPEKGTENFKTAQDAMFRARATYLMSESRFFEAQDFIENQEGPTEKTRAEVRKNFIKMQKGANARRFFETVNAASVNVVEIQEKVLADDMTAAQLDDRVLEVSAQAALAEDENTRKALTNYAGILADIRDIKMENILLRATGNTMVESELQKKYEALITKDGGMTGVNPTAYLSDFLDFQNSLVKEAAKGNISADHYNKWMFWSKVALQGHDFSKGWGSKYARQGGMNRRIKQFYKDHKNKSDTWKLDALREVYDKLPAENLELLGDDAMEMLFKRGKNVATLNEIGYPVEVIDSKVIKTTAGNFKVIGEDQDGMPIVEVPTDMLER